MVSRASRRVLGQTNSFCLVSRAKQAIFKHNDANSTVAGINMNTRCKRKNPIEPVQPKLKHPCSETTVEGLNGVLDMREDRTKFLSTILCLLPKHVLFKIMDYSNQNDSICNHVCIESSLIYPLLHKVGLVTTKHYQVTVNLKIS